MFIHRNKFEQTIRRIEHYLKNHITLVLVPLIILLVILVITTDSERVLYRNTLTESFESFTHTKIYSKNTRTIVVYYKCTGDSEQKEYLEAKLKHENNIRECEKYQEDQKTAGKIIIQTCGKDLATILNTSKEPKPNVYKVSVETITLLGIQKTYTINKPTNPYISRTDCTLLETDPNNWKYIQ